MRRLIVTDMLRGQKKKSYIILMGGVVVLIILLAVLAVFFATKAEKLIEIGSLENGKANFFLSAYSATEAFIPFMVGIPIFAAVFMDDFKSRTMQTAIGRGISRDKLILSRFIEVILMMVEAYIVFGITAAICGAVLGATAGGIAGLIGKMFLSAVVIVAHISCAMFLLYLTQNPTVGLVFYILFEASVFKLLFSLLDSISFLKDNNISPKDWIPSGIYTNASNYLLGVAEINSPELDLFTPAIEQDIPKGIVYLLILIGAYIILPVILSQVVFRKKELDF